MRLRITELRQEKSISRISQETGIGRNALTDLDKGVALRVHLVYLDALIKYFNVPCGALFDFDDVELPLKPTIRPDRRARR